MAQAVLWNKQVVEVGPDNWNELALRERRLREESFGRKLTLDESTAIIRAFQQKGLARGPIDYRAGIDQAADSPQTILGSEAIGAAARAAGVAIGEAGSAINRAAGSFEGAAADAGRNLVNVAGVGLGLYMLWKFFQGKR